MAKQLERNDIQGALGVIEELSKQGRINRNVISTLVKLQDDPTALLAAIAAQGIVK